VLLRRSLAAALLLGLLTPAVARAASPHSSVCTDATDEVHHLDADRFGATGRYALPAAKPAGLVVFFHGYGHTADNWEENLRGVAARDGVIALAMDYPGALDASGRPTEQTWQVEEGAIVSNAAAQWFDMKCTPGIVVAYGVSMGGNASGLAVAASHDLYDYWFDIEGANNVIETYNEARALAPASPFAAEAAHGIELEMGGKFEDQKATAEYQRHTNVLRAEDIAASGIQGEVMVHAVDDGLVPYNQGREMQAALAGRVPVQFWTVLTAGRDQTDPNGKDTTIEGYGQDYDGVTARPLAGHSNETNPDSRVSWVGFDRLDQLFKGTEPTLPGDFAYDEDTGVYTAPVLRL
jgi:hypothetical protein